MMYQIFRFGLITLLASCIATIAYSQATATIVKDIATDWRSSNPSFLTVYNNELYFSAENTTYGRELWKTDGTDAGTVLVKDINPGDDDSDPEWLTVSNGYLYFSANDGINGSELWRTDGTENGTQLVKDIHPGNGNSYPKALAEFNGSLYFSVTSSSIPITFHGLWKSDGTEAGTQLVASYYSNIQSLTRLIPDDLIELNGELFFTGYSGSIPIGRVIGKSNGTEAGTVMVTTDKDKYPFGLSPKYLASLNNELYFEADIISEEGRGLYKIDVFTSEAVLVKDMNVSNLNGGAQYITNINNTLFFNVHDGSANGELWKSNGTEAGTVLVADINQGAAGSHPHSFIFHNGLVYFTATTDDYGREIWKTDGTASGTSMIEDFYEGPSSPITFIHELRGMVSFNNNLYFVATLDNNLGQELYKLNESVLPVVWESVNIQCKNGLPVLSWATSSEINTNKFVVQASNNGIDWINRDSISASGYSNSSISYEYAEKNSFSNYNYYRILQSDIDGNFTYSKVLNSNCGSMNKGLKVYPNPAVNSIYITGIDKQKIKQVEIIDLAGRVVSILNGNSERIDISTLQKGTYLLNITDMKSVTYQQIIIKN